MIHFKKESVKGAGLTYYQPVEYRDYMSCDLYFHKDQDDGSLLSDIYRQGSFMFDCEDEIRTQISAYQPSLFGPFGLDD